MRLEGPNGEYGFEVDTGFDAADRRVLVVDGVVYDDFEKVLQAHPQLEMVDALALFCEAWIRMYYGSGYRVVRDPDEFKMRYRRLMNRGRGLLPGAQSSVDGVAYDVTEVAAPELQDDVLRYYVEDRNCGIPYRVEMPWPVCSDAIIEFLLLPIEYGEEDDSI